MNAKIQLFVLLFCITTYAEGQVDKSYPLKQYGSEVPYKGICIDDTSCFDCGKYASFRSNLTDYFLNEVPESSIKEITGVVFVMIVIDSFGKVCCHSIHNLTLYHPPEKILALKLQEYVNAMPSWTPAVFNGKRRTSVSALEFRFNVDFKTFQVIRHLMN